MSSKFYLDALYATGVLRPEAYIYKELTNLGYDVLVERNGLYNVRITWKHESVSKQLSMSFKWETNDEESFNKVVRDAVKFFQKNRPGEENLAMMNEALE